MAKELSSQRTRWVAVHLGMCKAKKTLCYNCTHGDRGAVGNYWYDKQLIQLGMGQDPPTLRIARPIEIRVTCDEAKINTANDDMDQNTTASAVNMQQYVNARYMHDRAETSQNT